MALVRRPPAEVISFCGLQSARQHTPQRPARDFDEDCEVDFTDVVELLFQLS